MMGAFAVAGAVAVAVTGSVTGIAGAGSAAGAGRAAGAGLLALVLAVPAPATRPAPAPAKSRVRYTINERWRFAPGDTQGAEARDFADRAWDFVDLPHTWNAADAFTEATEYRRGIGWYRRQLTLDPDLRGKRLFLHFEGANQVADVYVNGRSAGRHIGGYTAFAFDITDHVRFDASNVLAVRVDNRHDENIPPLNADFTFYGGIYRDVWLIATEPVHVTLLDHASPGVFIDTPEVSAERATVRVRGTVINATNTRRRVDVVNRVIDANNVEVTVLRSRVDVPAKGNAGFEQLSTRITRPRLWSPAEPNLYRVITEIHDGGTLTDRVENPLGFRWFEADAQQGFSLNGKPLRLYGTNRHQDRAGYGNALPDWAHRADVDAVKATGFNFLRLAHYPQDPAVLAAMDRAGLVGWEEIPVVNIIALTPEFAANSERMLVEMIRQHYNHPSILFWGYMNEVLLRKPNPMPDGYLARVLELAKRLDARAKAEDATRATVMAISIEEIDDGSGMQDVSDIIGFNLYFGWYYRTLDGLGVYLDSLHARNPTRPLMVSEYGADSDERIHTTSPVAFDFSIEHQQRFHENQFPQMRARDYLIGTAVWNQFDFGSKGRHDSKPNLNQKGLLYFDRKPKDLWHYYHALLVKEPVLHIAVRDWPRRAGSRAADARQDVVVYTNTPQVELFANDESLGTQPVENAMARWVVPLRAGNNRLEARASGAATDVAIVHYEDRSARTTIAVNAGSHYQYIDAGGTVWEADRPYQPGGWGHIGVGEPRLRHHRIFGSDEDGLYQAFREGAEQYRFDVPDGTYEVRLLITENETDKPGERVFNVDVNDVSVWRDLDLVAAYGRYAAVDKTVIARAQDGKGVIVRLQPTVGQATISGVMLRKL